MAIKNCDVILHNEAIQSLTKAKFIGIIVDQHLNWKDHISMVSHKISKSRGIISRIRNTLDIKSKKMIYYSLIHPYLTVSMSGPLPIELMLKPYAQLKRGQCVHSLIACYCSAAPFERYLHQSENFASRQTD